MIVGIGLGILIGVISGIVALIFLRTANSVKTSDLKSIAAVTTEILAIPTFWFGGPWVTSSLIVNHPISEFIDPYVATLAITFSILLVFPIYKWVYKLGLELGQEVDRSA